MCNVLCAHMCVIAKPLAYSESACVDPCRSNKSHMALWSLYVCLCNFPYPIYHTMAAVAVLSPFVAVTPQDYHRITSESLKISNDDSIPIPVGLLACQR